MLYDTDGVTPIVVVPYNDERVAINKLIFTRFCAANSIELSGTNRPVPSQRDWRKRGCIRVNADLSIPDQPRNIHELEWKRLRRAVYTGIPVSVSADATAKEKKDNSGDSDRMLLGELDLVIGQQLMVLRNENTACGIVNGTVAELVDVVFTSPEDECNHVKFERESSMHGNGVHIVLAKYVKALILRYTDQSWSRKNPFPDIADGGCFPLYLTAAKKGRRIRVDHQNAIVKISQFAATPAFALTGNKVQGSTLSQLIVGSWKKDSGRKEITILSPNATIEERTRYAARLRYATKQPIGSNGYLYVLLSRVRSSANLYILESIPTGIDRYRPRDDIIQEMKRLSAEVFDSTATQLRSIESGHSAVDDSVTNSLLNIVRLPSVRAAATPVSAPVSSSSTVGAAAAAAATEPVVRTSALPCVPATKIQSTAAAAAAYSSNSADSDAKLDVRGMPLRAVQPASIRVIRNTQYRMSEFFRDRNVGPAINRSAATPKRVHRAKK